MLFLKLINTKVTVLAAKMTTKVSSKYTYSGVKRRRARKNAKSLLTARVGAEAKSG